MPLSMRSVIRYLIRLFLATTSGKKRFQGFYALLMDVSLRGMNYRSGDFKTSGELNIIEKLAGRIPAEKHSAVLFDAGANTGEYSAALANAFKGRAEIYSFEPSLATYEILCNKVAILPEIHTVHAGLSDVESTGQLHKIKDRPDLASLYRRDLREFGTATENTESVMLTTVDVFSRKHGIERIDFLKIDVEGHEKKVLAGASDMIDAGKIDYIQFEFGEANVDSRTFLKDYFELLEAYSLYRIVRNGIYPLGQYRSEYEIFKTVNFFAERIGLLNKIMD